MWITLERLAVVSSLPSVYLQNLSFKFRLLRFEITALIVVMCAVVLLPISAVRCFASCRIESSPSPHFIINRIS